MVLLPRSKFFNSKCSFYVGNRWLLVFLRKTKYFLHKPEVCSLTGILEYILNVKHKYGSAGPHSSLTSVESEVWTTYKLYILTTHSSILDRYSEQEAIKGYLTLLIF